MAISSGLVENIGVNGHIKAKGPINPIDEFLDVPTHAEAILAIQQYLKKQDLINVIEAIGHRVVHGGKYVKSEPVTQEVIDYIRSITLFAPLHEPAHAIGMEEAKKYFPSLPQVAVLIPLFIKQCRQKLFCMAFPMKSIKI